MSDDSSDAPTPNSELPDRAEGRHAARRAASKRRQLLKAHRAAQSMIEALPNAIFFMDTEGRYCGVNKAWEWLFGLDRARVVGKRANELFSGNAGLIALFAPAHATHPAEEAGSTFASEICDAEGALHDVLCYRAPYTTPEGEHAGFIGTIVDITERKRAEEAVKYMAMHDALTRLPNRAMFNERLARAIPLAQRHNRGLAVLFIDLDRFKLINDTLGHEAGDEVLREAASRLTDNLRGGDTVARLGGDEFIVLLEDVPDPVYIGSVSQKLINALAAPFTIREREYRITASIGVSVYPSDGRDAEALLKHADIAMYRAKEQGRNAFEFYSERLSVDSLERLSLESGLRRALERDELVLHFQPQIEACTGRIVGMEALVRWQHPELGLLAPARFIRLAEETGLIVPLGEWVMLTACKAYREWRKLHLPLGRIAVNLSPRQFLHANLVKDTLRILEGSGCSGRFIELEITESMVMQDPSGAIATIDDLKSNGLRIAMDDFGTGYSSLAHLKRFPIDSIKVDRSFLAEVPDDAGNVAITQAIIALARTLHLTVIAEGVETAAQFNFLRSRGCDEVQGFYFSPPLAFPEATAFLSESAARISTNAALSSS